jgi:hypothetical protein
MIDECPGSTAAELDKPFWAHPDPPGSGRRRSGRIFGVGPGEMTRRKSRRPLLPGVPGARLPTACSISRLLRDPSQPSGDAPLSNAERPVRLSLYSQPASGSPRRSPQCPEGGGLEFRPPMPHDLTGICRGDARSVARSARRGGLRIVLFAPDLRVRFVNHRFAEPGRVPQELLAVGRGFRPFDQASADPRCAAPHDEGAPISTARTRDPAGTAAASAIELHDGRRPLFRCIPRPDGAGS